MSNAGLVEALRRLEQAWAAAGSDVAARLAPGRAALDVEAALAGAGLVSTDDVATWFAWHDGRAEKVTDIGPVMVLLSLDEALAMRDQELQLAEELAVEAHDPPWEPPDRWDPAWLPVVRFVHGGAFVVVCDGESPPEVWRYEHEVPPGRRVAASLTELVDGWCRLLDGGHWEPYGEKSWSTSGPPPPELRSFQP